MRDRAATLVRQFLEGVEVPGSLAALVSASADRLDSYLASDERWQALALPCEAAEACGGAAPIARTRVPLLPGRDADLAI